MKDEHITNMIDNTPLALLGESELSAIRAHTGACPECRRAFEAAQVSALLLRERAAETFEPSPFFQTRVLAALRERRAATETSALRRLWQATGALVSSMAVTVAALVLLTFIGPSHQPPTGAQQQLASATDSYSAEEVIFDQDNSTAGQMSYGQVLTTLYDDNTGR
jgi:predicted anti-sigma-YlaC factor YlaD